jgi:hypothetical protein
MFKILAMNSALEWIRSKAWDVPNLSQPLEYEGRMLKSEWKRFKGKVPYHMTEQLKKISGELKNDEYENETLRHIHTPSGHPTGVVEYQHVIYKPV